ncbi:MAG: hypothetical protein CL930_08555 [Deltaproteobacteria bacterium]|nr:hypothetical protein [Deltaproteobacteria bacterium]
MLGGKGDADNAKVLRIGVVQDGKVVHERLIKPGQSVTIGESPRNTFVFASKVIPKRFTLFQAKGGKYFLNLVDGMGGKIASDSQVSDVAELSKGAGSGKKSDSSVLPLVDRSRGKVVIGNVTVLFQFVPAPPESARMVNRQDFRPKLFDEDDPVFVGSLAVFMAMAAVLMIYVWSTPPSEMETMEELPDRFVEILTPQEEEPEEVTPVEELVTDAGKEVEKEVEKEKAKEKKPEKKPESEAEKKAAEAARTAKKREDVIAKSKLLTALIGTRGDTDSNSMVEDLFADRDASIGSIQDALQGVDGVAVATSDAMGVKKGGSGGREDAKIGDLAKSGGGDAKVDSGPATKVTGKATLKGMDAGSSEHAGSITSVVKKKKGQVQYCYELRLKENPNIGGRLAISVEIAGGRVTNVRIDDNKTGDKAIESCVIGKVRRWRFDAAVSESIYLPFALSAN